MTQVNIYTSPNGSGGFESEAQLCSDTGKTTKLTPRKIDDTAAIATLQDYFPRISSGLMPPGLRWVSPDRRIIAFEQPPRYITVSFTNAEAAHIENKRKVLAQKQYIMPMPWLFYVVYLSPQAAPLTIYVFATRHQMMTMDHELFSLPMTNFNNDGKLCRAAPDKQEMEFPTTLEGAMAATFYGVWMTGFNNDLAGTLIHAAKNGTPKFLTKFAKDTDTMLKGWSQQSISTVVDANWPKCPHVQNFKQLIDSKAVTTDYAVETGSYFTSRMSAAFQNNS